MRSEGPRFEEMAPRPEALDVDEREVSRLGQCGPDRKWEGAVRAAVEEARALVAPRARWAFVAEGGLDGMFGGGTPVEEIARRGERWVFVATIGPVLETRVRDHFRSGRNLEAVLLDAAGSAAAEAVCDLVERRCAAGSSSARFSPGYCGWLLDGQRAIFSQLRPEDLGVRLLPSLLMEPLKSVSGIVVRAPSQDLLVPGEVCGQCDARGCTRRRMP